MSLFGKRKLIVPFPCLVCGKRQKKLRRSRCDRCYAYRWRTGREWTDKKEPSA
jgi:hypothetical protein